MCLGQSKLANPPRLSASIQRLSQAKVLHHLCLGSGISSGLDLRSRLGRILPLIVISYCLCSFLAGTSSAPGKLVLRSVDSFIHTSQYPGFHHGASILLVLELPKIRYRDSTRAWTAPPTWYRLGSSRSVLSV